MKIRTIGLITNSQTSQGSINSGHAQDIQASLTALGYATATYDLAEPADLDRLLKDRAAGKLDLVFNNAAGKRGGDGSIEGLLEVVGIPYVGSDVLATAAAFDKKTTKLVVASQGVPIIRDLDFHREQFEAKPDWVLDEIEYGLKFPVIVKASQGSDSIGVSLVRTRKELAPAIKRALAEDDQILVEDFIKRYAEVTCFVLGNGKQAKALAPVERVFEGVIYSIDLPGRSYRIPTHLDAAVIRTIEKYSVAAHRSLGCSDYSRSDFIITRQGKIYFLEVNAHAGLGKVGPPVFAAKHSHGWDHKRLIQELVRTATKRLKQAVA